MTPGRALIPLLLACAPASAAAPRADGFDGLPRRIIAEGLAQRDLGLVGLGAEGPLTLTDDQRTIVPGALAFLSVDPADEPAPPEPWRLELVDGQVLMGRPRESIPGETITWELAGGASLLVPLDLVRCMAESSTPRLPFSARAEARDLVLTAGGDRLVGFVAGLGSGVLIETDTGVVAVELSQVREVRLASDPEPASAPLMWLSDGTVLAARPVGPGEGVRIEFEPVLEVVTRGRQSLSRVVGEVLAMNFAPARLRPLSALGPPAVAPAEGRRWTPGPEFGPPGELDLSAITLPGPMTLTWPLPRGAVALSLRAALAPQARRWGDCLLRIETDGPSAAPRAEVRLSADSPAELIRIDLAGASELRLILLPGERGPIQDRVIISEALLLVEHDGA